MFCTGGIRCEKASAFMLKEGFEEVYHLQGGILKYLEEVPQEESTWEGECFVFDNRVAVDHDLQKGQYDQCYGCRHPITEEDKQSESIRKGCAVPTVTTADADQKARFRERQKQIELAPQRGEVHVGAAPPERRTRRASCLQVATLVQVLLSELRETCYRHEGAEPCAVPLGNNPAYRACRLATIAPPRRRMRPCGPGSCCR